jgi:hypothetical protein
MIRSMVGAADARSHRWNPPVFRSVTSGRRLEFDRDAGRPMWSRVRIAKTGPHAAVRIAASDPFVLRAREGELERAFAFGVVLGDDLAATDASTRGRRTR